MNQRVRGSTILYFLLGAVLALFTACGAEPERTLGHETGLPPQTEAVVTCSQECAERGWCGTLEDQRTVVLGNVGNPVTDPQDVLLLQDTRVFIESANIATLMELASGEQFQIPFYRVTALDLSRTGWVPGWCLASP